MAKGVSLGRSVFAVFFAAILAVGCGGGGSSGTGVKISKSVSNPIAPFKAGAFRADITRANLSTAVSLMLLGPTGQFVVIFAPDDLTFGQLTVELTAEDLENLQIRGVATDYVFESSSWVTRQSQLSGTASSSQTATFVATASDESTFSYVELRRDNVFSDKGVSIAELSNTYSMIRDSLTTAVTIGVDGVLSGVDGTGCTLTGQITIPDTAISLFRVSYSATGCGPESITGNGDFNGVGSFDADQSEILFAATDGDTAFLFLN